MNMVIYRVFPHESGIWILCHGPHRKNSDRAIAGRAGPFLGSDMRCILSTLTGLDLDTDEYASLSHENISDVLTGLQISCDIDKAIVPYKISSIARYRENRPIDLIQNYSNTALIRDLIPPEGQQRLADILSRKRAEEKAENKKIFNMLDRRANAAFDH